MTRFLLSVFDSQSFFLGLLPRPRTPECEQPVLILSTWLNCTVYWNVQSLRSVASGCEYGPRIKVSLAILKTARSQTNAICVCYGFGRVIYHD